MEVTHGHLLGGRLHYAQPREGYRTGIEPVLLAASVPAVAGERVLEAGSGAGAGLMCLAARVPGVRAVGVEIDPAIAALARQNIEANRLAGLDIVTGDIGAVTLGLFDHAFANPPWHDSRSTASPNEARRRAKQAQEATLATWIGAIGHMLRAGGSLTLILPAAQLDRAQAALTAHGLGGGMRQELLPKSGQDAKLAIVQARRGEHRNPIEAPKLVLHAAGGAFTPPVEAVLRQGAALPG